MKNHFFYPYVGNKREEVEHIYNLLDLNNINTIVEPFCGSCAVSYYIWSQNKDKNYKYILNDLDSNLINLLKSIRNCEYKDIENEVNKMREEILEYENNMIEAKTIYLKHVKSGKLSGYILGHKYYKLRSFCFPLNELNKFNKKLDLSIAPIYDFLKNANIELYNEDANKIIDDNDNEQSLIFLDPPYIVSCNDFYSTDTGENICNIYEKLYYYKLKNYKSKIIICHENNWLFKILFREYLDGETEYNKNYQGIVNGKGKKKLFIFV